MEADLLRLGALGDCALARLPDIIVDVQYSTFYGKLS